MQIITKTQNSYNCNSIDEEGDIEIRKGPWSREEDNLLTQYMSCHDEGHWNSLAKCAGLKRTGKSCRLRWLNYLKPDIKRGNLTGQERFLILQLHSLWGNRWSKIARFLPGRTDNEIKNYWRTRFHKHGRQLRIESNSQEFLEEITGGFIPRLMEMEQSSSSNSSTHLSPQPPRPSPPPPPPSSIVTSSNMEPEKTRSSTKHIEIDSMETYYDNKATFNDNFYENISTSYCFDPINLLGSHKDLSNMNVQMGEPNWSGDDMTGGALW